MEIIPLCPVAPYMGKDSSFFIGRFEVVKHSKHLFGYEINGEKKQIESSFVVKGENQTYTAMAKTVGLPVAIAALKIVKGEIRTPGVQLPISKEVYEPILKELAENGIAFKEKNTAYLGYNPNQVTL